MRTEQSIEKDEERLRARYDRWRDAFEPVTQDQEDMARDLPSLFFDREIYDRRYKGRALKKYLVMRRLYHFLLYCFLESKTDRFLAKNVTYDDWAVELCEEREFRDAHLFFGRYYPAFSEYINSHLGQTRHRKEQEKSLARFETDEDSPPQEITAMVLDWQHDSENEKKKLQVFEQMDRLAI